MCDGPSEVNLQQKVSAETQELPYGLQTSFAVATDAVAVLPSWNITLLS